MQVRARPPVFSCSCTGASSACHDHKSGVWAPATAAAHSGAAPAVPARPGRARTCTQQLLPAGVYSRELKTSAEEHRVARQLADLARSWQIGRRRRGERRWPGASAPTRSSIQRGMHLGSTPWSSGSARLRVRLCGAPAGEGVSRRCVHHTLPDVSGRFTRACRWQRSWPRIISRQH